MATFLRKPAAVQVWRYGGPALAPELADDALWITASGLQAMQVPIGPSKHWGGNCGEEDCQERWTITVETAHGTANVRVGDWIAKGPIDWWPIDDEHFQATYTSVADLAQRREEWQALVDADTLHMIPVEAHIASVKHLAQELLDLTADG